MCVIKSKTVMKTISTIFSQITFVVVRWFVSSLCVVKNVLKVLDMLKDFVLDLLIKYLVLEQ